MIMPKAQPQSLTCPSGYRCMGGAPALLWRIEVQKARLEVLSHSLGGPLSVDIAQLLKNPESRRQFVHADDVEQLGGVMRQLQRGEDAMAVFRLANPRGGTVWMKLAGHADPDHAGYVTGHVVDITETALAIRDKVCPQAPRRPRRSPSAIRDSFDSVPVNDDSIETVLEILFRTQVGPAFDGILFSDIMQRKNKVVVYSYGRPFESMEQAKAFPFVGTIAETVTTFGLDHLIVDDTLDSIKAIDWALFIPAGIRSYFAKPFFNAKGLHSVLILCSTEPGQFPESRIDAFEPLYAPFEKAVAQWRKAKGRR
ncbi:MAG: hypothetical protein KDE22_02855 [Rhodobacterales bacterium]|nr:hypothetical protein [Rhodobacterales bacterium]